MKIKIHFRDKKNFSITAYNKTKMLNPCNNTGLLNFIYQVASNTSIFCRYICNINVSVDKMPFFSIYKHDKLIKFIYE